MIAIHVALALIMAIKAAELHIKGWSWTDQLWLKSIATLAVVTNTLAAAGIIVRTIGVT